MITLTSAQEAAFNAAQEAASDLELPMPDYGHRFILFFYKDSVSAAAAHPYKKDGQLFGTSLPTAAEAVRDLLTQIEEAKNAPPKLTTAKEAIDAVKKIIESDTVMIKNEIINALNELPVE